MINYRRTVYVALAILSILVGGISWTLEREGAARWAIQACDAGWRACRAAQGYAPQHCRLIAGKLVNVAGGTETPCTEPEPNEDESVCGEGWRACRNTAAEGAE